MMKHDFLRRMGALMLTLAMALSLVIVPAGAAGGDGENPDPDPGTGSDTPIAVTSVALDKGTLSLTEGESGTLTATVEPTDATDKTVTWKSDDETVATVANGTVTALKEGTATITATAGDKSATCTVIVNAATTTVPVTGITLDPTSLTLAVDGTATLIPTITPSNATNKTIDWSSSEISVASVANGVVTAKKVGTTTITALVDGKSATCTVTVTAKVVPATNISLNTNSHQFNYNSNRTYELRATLYPADTTETTVLWESGDTSVVTVAPQAGTTNAVITAVAPGSTKVTAKTADGTHAVTCTVTVSGIVLDKHELSLLLGKSETLSIGSRSYGEAAGTGDLVWTTGNSGVASVSGGTVTARGVGSVMITVTRGNYSDTCSVTVKENTAAIVIAGQVTAGNALSLSGIVSELNSRAQTVLGTNLSYITNVSINPNQGIVYYNYKSVNDTGSGVGNADKFFVSPQYKDYGISGLTFVPNTAFSGNADITYTGWNSSNQSFTGTIRVTVNKLEDVTYSTSSGNAVYFQASDFNAVCRNRTGRDLSYVTFTLPAASAGTLYYNYTGQTQYAEKVTASIQYSRTRTPYLESVTFLPTDDYVGTLRIAYRGVDTAGGSFNGQITINVQDRNSNTGSNIRYNANQGQRVTFLLNDFTAACQQMLPNQTLNYVVFTLPDSRQGTLYYSYNANSSSNSLVTAGTRYYRYGTPGLSYITFVPANNSLDKVSIDYTAYTNNGERFSGTVTVNYSGEESDVIPYTAYAGRSLQFESADFNEMCQRMTGRPLDHIRFTSLPSTTQGTLYSSYYAAGSSGYSVSLNSNYYRTSLSNITFVPRSGYVGTVSIGFTGYDTSGYTFSGVVYIAVEQGYGTTTVSYRVRSGESVAFTVSDFNNACLSATGANLNYIRFESLPSTSRGELYYRYNQTSSGKVNVSTSYYASNSGNTLNQVSFVSASGAVGTVEIPYVGWSVTNVRFTGTIKVEIYMPTAETVQYSGSSAPIPIRASDLRRVCNAVMSRELSHIQFTTLPAASAGRLYYNYSSSGTGAQVSTGTSYYYGGSPSIDQLSFVPVAGYRGTVSLSYTATDMGGEQISGTVLITLSGSVSSSFNDMNGHTWAIPAVEYLYQNGVVNGVGNGQFAPARTTSRAEFAVMICRAFDFQSSVTSSFPDVPANSYYAQSVAAAKAYGIVNGSNGMFMPNNAVSRQEAMVMLYRALMADGWSLNGMSADLSGFADNGQIADYAWDAVAALVQLGIVNGSNGNINPRATVSRAEMAAMLYRAMTL